MDLNVANDVVTVFIVEPERSVRDSLARLVRASGWQSEVFGSAEGFLGRPPHTGPCCVLVDATLPGLSGLELQRRLAIRLDMPIIFITRHEDGAMIVRAMKAGAIDFLIKPFTDDRVMSAVREAIERSRIAVRADSERRALTDCYESLTSRERDVMALVVAGLLNKQVAGELGISEITVKTHRGSVMRKMKADSLPDLVRMAVRLGLHPAPKRLNHIPEKDAPLDPSPVHRRGDSTDQNGAERSTIERVILEMDRNLSMAARAMGISRTQLYVRLRKYGFSQATI